MMLLWGVFALTLILVMWYGSQIDWEALRRAYNPLADQIQEALVILVAVSLLLLLYSVGHSFSARRAVSMPTIASWLLAIVALMLATYWLRKS